ncbi:3-hydroxyanthranilate 3,4-dioxygenase [Limibacter armeniacum]|uniref:3-hydroxyanthranilate 3,4-dioxygenase n=1 Tax=Limibacter armeniacum TaxID=466084 RepID=UPI002FE5FEA7
MDKITNPFSPVNLKQWIDQHRELLKPPVGNKVVYEDGAFIIMIVGGPNSRKDYHYNETPEFFYQVEGNITLKIIDNGEFKDIPIKEGEVFLLQPKIPHSPQRPAGSIGLVIESKRPEGVKDAFEWYCESCGHQLYREPIAVSDIVTQLPIIFEQFYQDKAKRTCTSCSHVMEPPKKPAEAKS